SAQAPAYARYRPGYPDALFEYLSGLAPDRQVAWDCATGNGQAAVSAAKFFERVIATDASETQIAHAFRLPGIDYRVAPAEKSGLDDSTVALVTIAQALHWLPIPEFFAEARRALKPNGIIAVWCCSKSVVNDQVTEILRR